MNDKYIQTYKKAFEDNDFIKLMPNFSNKNWSVMNLNSRFEIIKQLEVIVSRCFNKPLTIIKSQEDSTINTPYYSATRDEINFSESSLKQNAFYVLSYYFHEKRHKHQFDAMRGLIKEDDELIKKWSKNVYTTPITGLQNYRPSTKVFNKETFEEYIYQPTEEDAFTYGHELAYIVGKMVEKKAGFDSGFFEYYRDEYLTFQYNFKEMDSDRLDRKKEVIDKIEKENDENIKKGYEEKNLIDSLNGMVSADVEIITKQHFNYLLNEDFFHYLSTENKIILLNEYVRRNSVLKKVNISIRDNDSDQIIINDKVFQSSDIDNQVQEIKAIIKTKTR